MNIYASIALAALAIALILERRRFKKYGKRGHSYELIDLQRKIRQDQEGGAHQRVKNQTNKNRDDV